VFQDRVVMLVGQCRYFAMLSGQGWTIISGCRQFFYVRYMEWAVSLPMIIILLGLVAGAEWVTILGAIGSQSKPPRPASVVFRQSRC
jgi:bacteriorhodopsin